MESQQPNLETSLKIRSDNHEVTVLNSPLKAQSDHHEVTVLNSESPPRLLPETVKNQGSPPRVSINDSMKKIVTPYRLRVPVAFKHPERYRSPTDAMMSPVTQGLLARSRKPSGSLIPPSFNLSKA
ncbi:hypothetical protein F2Q69_00028640 [Brassica cretica]|uniref:Uncharacterized protein n=1 Tax=Brassica cretica TaxID=69181 RepID=A0A8S9S443_BRACR|nr:hypothetical protein F2Q69_00028640 [Brassica cretica]